MMGLFFYLFLFEKTELFRFYHKMNILNKTAIQLELDVLSHIFDASPHFTVFNQ